MFDCTCFCNKVTPFLAFAQQTRVFTLAKIYTTCRSKWKNVMKLEIHSIPAQEMALRIKSYERI